jgi:crotonobetainyl-CoA:carnitine CoA-transferase CaiB-like acyl-CoA transferase
VGSWASTVIQTDRQCEQRHRSVIWSRVYTRHSESLLPFSDVQKSGRGQTVEVAMVNGLISLLAYLSSEYFATGKVAPRTGNDHPLVYPYGLFTCSDGQIAVANSHDQILRRFLGTLDLGWIMQDPRFDTNPKRMAGREELREMINARMAGQSRDHWIEVLNAAGVPCGVVQDLHQVFTDPQVAAQQMVIEAQWQGANQFLDWVEVLDRCLARQAFLKGILRA